MACKNMMVSNSVFLYSINDKLNRIAMVIIFLLYFRMLWKIKFRLAIPKKTTLMILGLVLFCVVTFIVDPVRFTSTQFPYKYVRIQGQTFLIYCLPLFFCISLLEDFRYLVNQLYRYSGLLFLFATISFGAKILENKDMYSMSYGYNAIWCFIIYCFKYNKERKFLQIIVIILTGIYILTAGSRGPLLCMFAAGIILFFKENLTTKKIVIVLILSSIVIIVLAYFNQIINWSISFLNSINVSSRTLVLLSKGNIGYTSDRERFHQAIYAALRRSPLIGLGAFGGEATTGLAHGLYIDIFANFGYPFGIIYILFMYYNIFKIISHRDNPISDFVCMLSCIVLPIGFFDSEFWISKELWMIMGALIAHSTEKYKSLTEKNATVDHNYYM